MNLEIIPALALFAFTTSITPGPNNLMLMTSGANFGFKKTLPHMFGVSLGFSFMVILVGLGIVKIFELFPISYDILKVLSIVYLLYLAFKIATSSSEIKSGKSRSKPMTFLLAAAFQWVNPKGWTMALTAISVYAPTQSLEAVALISIVYVVVNIPSVTSWTVLGKQIQRFLTSQKRLQIFNITMATLLVLSLYPALV